MWFVCCSPEDEPQHSWLGAAAEAGKGEDEATARPPPSNPSSGRCRCVAGPPVRVLNVKTPSGRFSFFFFSTVWEKLVCVCARQEAAGRNQMPGGLDHDRNTQMLVPPLDVRIRAPNHEPTLNGWVRLSVRSGTGAEGTSPVLDFPSFRLLWRRRQQPAVWACGRSFAAPTRATRARTAAWASAASPARRTTCWAPWITWIPVTCRRSRLAAVAESAPCWKKTPWRCLQVIPVTPPRWACRSPCRRCPCPRARS